MKPLAPFVYADCAQSKPTHVLAGVILDGKPINEIRDDEVA